MKPVTVTTATAQAIEGDIVLADATAQAITVTLASDSGSSGESESIVVKKVDASANTVTLDAAVGNIDGAATKVLSAQWAAVQVVFDGSNWYIVSAS